MLIPPFHLRGVKPKVTGYLFGDRILIDNDLSIIGLWTLCLHANAYKHVCVWVGGGGSGNQSKGF